MWSQVQRFLYVLLLCLPGVLSVLGNGILLFVAYRKKSSLKPAEFFVVNLAISDLSMTMSLFPLAIPSAYAHMWVPVILFLSKCPSLTESTFDVTLEGRGGNKRWRLWKWLERLGWSCRWRLYVPVVLKMVGLYQPEQEFTFKAHWFQKHFSVSLQTKNWDGSLETLMHQVMEICSCCV